MFKENRLLTTVIGLAAAIVLFGALGLAWPSASAQSDAGRAVLAPVGQAIHYQGRLAQSGVAANGTFTMSFTIHDMAEDEPLARGSLWSSGDLSIEVTDGLYQARLPIPASILNGEGIWLEQVVDGETLSPRQEILPVPMAHTALNIAPGASVSAYDSDGLISYSTTGAAIRATSDSGYGVYGDSLSGTGGYFEGTIGVEGVGVTDGSVSDIGGKFSGQTAIKADGNTTGIMATGAGSNGVGGGFIADYHAVDAFSSSGYAVWGRSDGGTAVDAYSNWGLAGNFESQLTALNVVGGTSGGTSVGGNFTGRTAIKAVDTDIDGSGIAVHAISSSGDAVHARSDGGTAVSGYSDYGYGGDFKSLFTALRVVGGSHNGPSNFGGDFSAHTAIRATSTGTDSSARAIEASATGPGSGISVSSVDGVGIRVSSFNGDGGVFESSNGRGISADSASGSGGEFSGITGIKATSTTGIGGEFTGFTGIKATTTITGTNGIAIQAIGAGNADGLRASSVGGEAIVATSSGGTPILALTSSVAHYDAQFNGPNGIYSANGFTSPTRQTIAVNLGDEAIARGDLVALAGVEVLEDGTTILGVQKATLENLSAIIGVADAGLLVSAENQITTSDDAIESGSMVAIITEGLAPQVNVGTQSRANFQIGDAFTVSGIGRSASESLVIGKIASEVNAENGTVAIFLTLP